MKEVYLLRFTSADQRLNDEEAILVGVYSSEEKAKQAKARVGEYNGFKDYKEGFEICPYTLDEDFWKAGFTIC